MSYDIVAIGVPEDVGSACDVLARGRQLARLFGADWIAVLIEKRFPPPDSAFLEVKQKLSQLVSALGRDLRCASAADIGRGLIEVAQNAHATLLVIGSSRRPRLLRLLRVGTTERVIRTPRSIDVIVDRRGART